MKWFLMVMMMSCFASAKTEGTIAVLYPAGDGLHREVLKIGRENVAFDVGSKHLSCLARVSDSGQLKSIFLTCLDLKSDTEYSVLTDCDKGETALQINSKKNKKTLPEITINANCKTIEDKI